MPVLLAACGGGGGSSGETQAPYTITLRTDKAQLPVNLANQRPSLGAYAPYTTTLYVEAKKSGAPIPGGEDIFGCNVAGGLDSGALYYLDGKPEHETEVDDGNGGKTKVPNAYRSITLGSNSGGNSFHFHAGDQAGSVSITCSVTDPRDKQVRSASVNIQVGGGGTNVPASIVYQAQAPYYLGTRDNPNHLRNNVAIEALVMNDGNQRISSSKPNVQLNILPTTAADGARLLANGQTGTALQVSTSGGVAQFSLSSGVNAGLLAVEMITDRADNDVSNGIQQPIRALAVIPAVHAVTGDPVIPDSEATLTVENGKPYTHYLEASGGLPPYQWSTTSSLPAGLTLSSSGVISGTTSLPAPGTFTLVLQVVDANGAKATKTVTLNVTGNLPDKPVQFAISGCASSDVNQACALPSTQVGLSYTYAFTATGGDNVKWKISGAPSWMKLDATGDLGVITSGNLLTCEDRGRYTFTVTAYNDTNSVTRQASIVVQDDPDPVVCTPPVTPTPTP
ncbi:Ig domain-containing protein [Comamonas humi]